MLKTNATELDLQDGDKAGSRIPGGGTLAKNGGSSSFRVPEIEAPKAEKTKGENQRVEYIN